MTDSEDTEIPLVTPVIEPEFVGAHSAVAEEQCAHYRVVEEGAQPQRCANDASHTVVMFDGEKLHELASCDECGDLDDVADFEREWSA